MLKRPKEYVLGIQIRELVDTWGVLAILKALHLAQIDMYDSGKLDGWQYIEFEWRLP